MKYLKLYESFESIENLYKICREYNITHYTINNDGSIDVNGVVNLHGRDLTEIPIKFNKVSGVFSCSCNELTTLEGSPVEINSNFYCRENRLTSFEYAPKIIRRGFYCENNNIKTFEYFPRYVGGVFECSDNPISHVWWTFRDTTKIELLNDFDIFREEDTDTPVIVMDRLNDFLLTIGKKTVDGVYRYKNVI